MLASGAGTPPCLLGVYTEMVLRDPSLAELPGGECGWKRMEMLGGWGEDKSQTQGVQAAREGVFGKTDTKECWEDVELECWDTAGVLHNGVAPQETVGSSSTGSTRSHQRAAVPIQAHAREKKNAHPHKHLGTNAHGSTIPHGPGGAGQVSIMDGR